jgi:threonyl-tRNA synthetase
MRNAEIDHVNYILVVGDAEMQARTVAVRNYKTQEKTTESISDFAARTRIEIETKAL